MACCLRNIGELFHSNVDSRHYAPPTVPFWSVPSACFAGGFAGRPSTADIASSISCQIVPAQARELVSQLNRTSA